MYSIVAILAYTAAWVLLFRQIPTKDASSRKKAVPAMFMPIVTVALVFHGIFAYLSIFTPHGYQLGVYQVAPLLFWVITAILLGSTFKKPLHNLFLFVLPLSVVSILISVLLNEATKEQDKLSPDLVAHILLSVVAYSLLTIASLQALFVAYQNKQLRKRKLGGFIALFPPLQTMEKLLFELIWAGQILLTLSILSGVIFIEDIFEQQLSHKTVFSILSWVIYSILLAGRHRLGWRGAVAIKWALCGFAALMLAYFGSKFVLEIILERA